MSNWWNKPENLPYWVTIEARSERTSIAAAGALSDRLQQHQTVAPVGGIQALMEVYTASNAERLRAIDEQLESVLYVTQTQMNSG